MGLELTEKGKEWIEQQKREHPEEMKELQGKMAAAVSEIPFGDRRALIGACYGTLLAPTVVNIWTAPAGWQNDQRYVYIGRFHLSKKYGRLPCSKWHNPFRGERGRAIQKFKEYLLKDEELMRDLSELRGKILVCYCKPLACHGDVLSRMVGELK